MMLLEMSPNFWIPQQAIDTATRNRQGQYVGSLRLFDTLETMYQRVGFLLKQNLSRHSGSVQHHLGTESAIAGVTASTEWEKQQNSYWSR
jgi:hypothetical protein